MNTLTPTRYALLACIISVLIACALGLWRLETESVWHDEGWSIRAIQSPFGTPDDNTPPLYYILMHGLRQLGAGETAFALRYGSVLFWLLSVALGVRIGSRWYGWRGGILAGVLLATSPLLWQYAQEIRAYVLVPLWALVLLYGAERLLKRPHIPKYWAFVGLAELAALYTHNLSVPLVAWLNLMIIGGLVWQRRGYLVSAWLILQGALFALYVPWLLTQSPSGTSLNTVPSFGRELSQDLWRGYVLPVLSDPDQLNDSFITLVHILPLLAGISTLLLIFRARTLRSILLFSQTLLLPIFSTLLLIQASIDFHPRYYILAVPPTLLLLVAGVDALPRQMKSLGGVMVAGLAVYVSSQGVGLVVENRAYQNDDYAALAAYYADLPSETLVIIPYEDEPALTHYYAPQMPIAADIIPLPLYSDAETAIDLINVALGDEQAQRVELLTWYQVPSDRRGMLGCLLASHSTTEPHIFESYGLRSEGYTLSRQIALSPFATPELEDAPRVPPDLEFRNTIGEVASGDVATCLKVDVSLNRENPQAEHYSLTARILNDFGWEIARADGEFLRDDQAPVHQWEDGDDGTAFLRLTLPKGAPPQAYDVLLRVYSPQQPSGYDFWTDRVLGNTLQFDDIPLQAPSLDDLPQTPTLYQDNTNGETLYSGTWLEIEAVAPETDQANLMLVGDNWDVSDTITIQPNRLFWTGLNIPVDAEGEAVLSLNDETLKMYDVVQIPRLWDEPPSEIISGVSLDQKVNLIGATVIKEGNRLQVELVWQPLQRLTDAYKAFVQLLDTNGQLLAQSDEVPAQGNRPTRGWVPDEYILDAHTLDLNAVNYRGEGSLIVGLYNPNNGQRLKTASGTDHITLTDINIE